MSDTYKHGYRLRIYPTDEQKKIIESLVHLYRFAYNWGIARQEEHYQKKKNGEVQYATLSYFDLTRLFIQFRSLPENAWLQEFPLATARLALRDVVHSYKLFFSSGSGHPKFKSKKRSPKMFKTRNDRFYIDRDRVRFEGLRCKLIGHGAITDTIDLHHNFDYYRTDGTKYIQPSISIDNLGQYWVSFSIEEPIIPLDKPKSEPIGIDVGTRQTMILSTREVFNRPKDKIKRLEKKLSRAQHHQTRDINRRLEESKRTKVKYDDVPVSKRAARREDKVRKLYKKITNVKNNWYHEIIKSIVTRNPECIVIETLHSRKIELENSAYHHKTRHAIHHADFYTMHQIIQDKCTKYGVPLIKANDQYPSSQICSVCGHIQNIGRSKTYHCSYCGNTMDRDINAAINLRNLAIAI